MPSIYALRDKLLSSGRQVFDLQQLGIIDPLPPGHAKVYAMRLVKKGFARRIMEGTISLTDDPLIIATQLIEPSYISFTSSLYLRGLIKQAPALVECVTTKISYKVRDLKIEYHRIVPELYFGYEQIERYGSYCWVATPEKAALDMMYFGMNYSLGLSLRKDQLLKLGHRYGNHGGNRGKRVKKWVKGYVG